VIPVHNPNFKATATAEPGQKEKGKPAKPVKPSDEEFPGLEGWKARGLTYTTKDGIVTAAPTNNAPFIGVGSAASGPATFKFRARCAKNSEAKIEWLKPSADKNEANPQSVAYTLNGGDWQEISVSIPAAGALGVLRFYLPANSGPVEIDWIDLQGTSTKKHWDF
jgi:hypothetical protein